MRAVRQRIFRWGIDLYRFELSNSQDNGNTMVHFKRYAVGVFTIYLVIIYVSFQNILNTAKQKHKAFGIILTDF